MATKHFLEIILELLPFLLTRSTILIVKGIFVAFYYFRNFLPFNNGCFESIYTVCFHFNLFLFNLHLLYICTFICTNGWFCIFMMDHFKLNEQKMNRSLSQNNAKSTKKMHVSAHVLFGWLISLLLVSHSVVDDSCTCIISIKIVL